MNAGDFVTLGSGAEVAGWYPVGTDSVTTLTETVSLSGLMDATTGAFGLLEKINWATSSPPEWLQAVSFNAHVVPTISYLCHPPRLRFKFRVPAVLPPRRVLPRDDGRAGSSTPRTSPRQSEQASNRVVGGYL